MINALITRNEIKQFINQAIQELDVSINQYNIGSSELCSRYNISRNTLRKYISKGLPYRYTIRHQYVFNANVVDSWINSARKSGKIK